MVQQLEYFRSWFQQFFLTADEYFFEPSEEIEALLCNVEGPGWPGRKRQ